MKNPSGLPETWLAPAVLLLMFGLALGSIGQKSPTFDEQGFITRGLGYLRGENRHMRVGHPLGLNALNASFLISDSRVVLPVADPSWRQSRFHRPSELFLWEVGNDVERVIFLARLPTIFLGLLLAAVTGRWARQMTQSRRAGLMALVLAASDPNILAHTRLATTDLGLAAGALLAGFTLWRFLKRPSWPSVLLAGFGFGLLQNTKFTAGLFVPLFALLILLAIGARWRENGRFPTPMLLQIAVGYPLAGFLTLWAAYGFQIGTLPDNLPTFPQLSGLTLPLSHHLEQLLDIGGRLQKGTPSFLLGHYSDSGWWYYFPVAFLLKTPLPTLILLIWAAALSVWRRSAKSVTHHVSRMTAVDQFALLIPPLGYFAIALTTDINLGYRHLLPVLPFLAVFIAAQFTIHHSQFTIHNSLLALLAAIAIWTYPHYLAYFNSLAGGPDNGWRHLADSNIDWGQDLAGLKRWMTENDVDHVWLSYFGEARPDYYDINYTGLDSFPPRLMNPQARPFYPHDPAPGFYAISATNLQGVQFADHDQFAWFRERQPIAKIGYSIFLYHVPAAGAPVDLALSGVQLDEIATADFALWPTNDATPHWFDAGQSLLLPGSENGWLAVGGETAVLPQFAAIIETFEPVQAVGDYALYRIPPPDDDSLAPTALFRRAGRIIGLLVDDAVRDTAVPGQTFTLTTRWRNQSAPSSVKIFIHLISPDGRLAAQWDGLGAAWEGWRAGDTLWQTHPITIPGDAQPGAYQIWAGLYHPETGARWQTTDGDRILLGELVVKEAGAQ